MKISDKIFILIAVIAIAIISGCVGQSGQQAPQQEPAASLGQCGNSVLEAGEECDKSECPEGSFCAPDCTCRPASEIPQIPE